MIFYKRLIGDIQTKTGHLSPAEMGAYDRLLDHYYSTEKSLPELDRCYSIVRAIKRDDQQAVRKVLAEFFTELEDGTYEQQKAEEMIAEAQPKIAAARANGAKGGRPKKPKIETQEKPTGLFSETQGNPTGQASQSQSNSVPNGTGAEAPKTPAEMAKAELWRAAVSVLENGGCPISQCRTFMGKLVQDYDFPIVKDAVAAAVTAQPADAREYLKATCMRMRGERKPKTNTATDRRMDTLSGLAGDTNTTGESNGTSSESFIDVSARVVA